MKVKGITKSISPPNRSPIVELKLSELENINRSLQNLELDFEKYVCRHGEGVSLINYICYFVTSS